MNTETTVAVMESQDLELVEREEALCQEVTDIEFQAGAITIDNEDDYKEAGQFGRLLKQRAAEVKDFWKPLKEAAHKAHAEICAREKAMLQPLSNAEKILKQTMGAYISEQERIRREAEEAARRAAQAEAERRLQEAIALEAQGKSAAADAAVEEAEIMDEMSNMVSVAAEKPKAEGVTTKKDWEIESIDSSKVPVLVAGVELRPVDTAAVMRLIRSTKGQVHIPGVVYKGSRQSFISQVSIGGTDNE